MIICLHIEDIGSAMNDQPRFGFFAHGSDPLFRGTFAWFCEVASANADKVPG